MIKIALGILVIPRAIRILIGAACIQHGKPDIQLRFKELLNL